MSTDPSFSGRRRTFAPLDLPLERVERGRDRRGRNRRIAAGVVGIAVFVAAVWIVTSGLSLDRSEKSVAPGGDVTGPAETGPAQTGPAVTGPPLVPASAASDVVRQGTCSDGASWRLELTDWGDRINVRFEIHRSPVGHSWHIVLRHAHGGIGHFHWHYAHIFESTRVASESGDLAVERSVVDRASDFFFFDVIRAEAADQQTGQVGKAEAKIGVV